MNGSDINALSPHGLKLSISFKLMEQMGNKINVWYFWEIFK